jgi:hypothetical protein
MRRQDPHEVPDLLKRYATLESRVRALELRGFERAAPAAAGTPRVFCAARGAGWMPGEFGANHMAVWDAELDEQSGGFSLLDDHRIAVPGDGIFVAEWSWSGQFAYTESTAPGGGDIWAQWEGGPGWIANGVRTPTSGEEKLWTTDAVITSAPDGVLTAKGIWRGMFRAYGGSNVFTGSIVSFPFLATKDFDVSFTSTDTGAVEGVGGHDLYIAQVG